MGNNKGAEKLMPGLSR